MRPRRRGSGTGSISRRCRGGTGREHVLCPFGAAYQLVRNVLAAQVRPSGNREPLWGHAVVVYDRRSPRFREGGAAQELWNAVADRIQSSSPLRRVTWQVVAGALAQAAGLAYLVQGLREKYGIEGKP